MENLIHQHAIELRLMGLTYAQIASHPEINVKENTIRSWFMKGGVCNKTYISLKKKRLQENRELYSNLNLQLIEVSVIAVKNLSDAVRDGDLRASIKVLDLIDIQKLLQNQTSITDNEGISLLREIIKARRKKSTTS